MSAPFELLLDLAHADTLEHRLIQYQQLQQAQAHTTLPPLDPSTLLAQLITATQQSLTLHSSLTQLAIQHAKQTRTLDRLHTDNTRLRRENDVCIDQLFLHSVPIEGVEGDVKRAMEQRKKWKINRRRKRLSTDRTTFLSGFESTDEDEGEEEEEGEDEVGVESGDDTTSQASVSSSECPSRADGQDSGTELSPMSEATVSSPSTAPLFESLVQSLTTHPSVQQINNHLTHLSTLLTLQASQPLPIIPATDFNRTGSTDSSGVYGRSTEMEAVMEVRVQLQRERTRCSRRIVGQLRQLVQHQSAEISAMRQELDVLRSAAYDAMTDSTARDTLQLHEWMATMAERATSSSDSRTVSGRTRETRVSVSVSDVCDVQQVCGLLDGVMRHVQDSSVRSQSYVEDVKRLCMQQSISDTSHVMESTS